MKKYILTIVLIILSCFIKVPKYKELNHLKIIDKIVIDCDEIILREVVPKRDDSGIEYEYKYHRVDNINKNKFYIEKSKVIDKCQNKKS